MNLITGNDLKTGAVTWWTGNGWSTRIEDAVDLLLSNGAKTVMVEENGCAFAVLKPVKQMALYAMYRNRIGRVWFSDLALTGVPQRAVRSPSRRRTSRRPTYSSATRPARGKWSRTKQDRAPSSRARGRASATRCPFREVTQT